MTAPCCCELYCILKRYSSGRLGGVEIVHTVGSTASRADGVSCRCTIRRATPYMQPLSETVFLILSSLAAGPRHGYAILQDVESITDGRVRLSTGTLYGALKRLLESGAIRRFNEKNPERDRQAYELTAAGRKVLAAELNRMRILTSTVSSRLAQREA